MVVELTQQQQQALDVPGDRPPRFIDPRTQAAYILIPLEEYEGIRETLEDEKRHKAISAAALRNAVGRMSEDA